MANAFGSITIVDMTDVGQFTTVPMSNAGIVMIYDPNAMSNNYTPSSMTLTPFTTYGGVDYTSHQGVTYSWYRRADGASINYTNPGTPTSTSSSVTVSSADFTSLSAKSITYYLKATYPIAGVGNVTAWGQISISLVTQATNIQDIEINGEHIFKYKYTDYNVSPTIDGSSTITLTATYTTNVAVYGWYYYDYSTSQYKALNGITGVTINGSDCTITHTSPIFSNNKAKIKVTARRSDDTQSPYTELTSVYDEYEIIKLFDGPVGAPGDKSISIVLSNEDQMIPCNGQGQPTEHAFDLATTTIRVLEGNTNITTNNASTGYVVTATLNGVTSTNGIQYDSTNQLYNFAVNGWDDENDSEQAYVTFEGIRTGYPTLTKAMSLTKIQTGEDGKSPTIYQLSVTPNSVTTNATGTTTAPVTLTASVAATIDTTTTDATTSANLYYEWIKSGTKDNTNSGVNKNTYSIAKDVTVTEVVCKIRKTNASGVVLDSQTVDFIPEGAKGDTGATGDGVISLDFPQNVDTIGLKTDGTLAAAYSIDLPYTVYQGSRVLTAQASGTGQTYSINGVTPNFTWGTNKITITIAKGTKLYDASKTGTAAHSLNGQFTIPINYTDAKQTAQDGTQTTVTGTVNGTFTWNLDIAPANGSSVTISDVWTRYRLTKSNVQPGTSSVSDITKSEATTVEGAIDAATTADKVKPYYIWSKTFTQYSPSGSASSYTVTYYPADPENGKSVQTTTDKKYACVSASAANAGTNPPSSGWNSSKDTAIGSTAKPYYVWERNVVSYKYSDNTSAGPDTTTYSVSYYPADTVELTLQANATIFNGVIQTITISPIVTKNGSEYTPTTAELTWSYMLNGQKVTVTSTTTSDAIYRVDSTNAHSLVVTAGAVNGSTSIQCKLETSGRTVYAYLPLTDDSDEFRCEPYSTIGETLINGQGSGFIECILYRNGYEIDKITAGPTVTSARVPTGTSPHAAVISVTTEMNSDPKPDNIKDINAITYTWDYHYADANGDLQPITDTTYNQTGKAVYIDGSMIDKKIVVGCTVDVTYIPQPSN